MEFLPGLAMAATVKNEADMDVHHQVNMSKVSEHALEMDGAFRYLLDCCRHR